MTKPARLNDFFHDLRKRVRCDLRTDHYTRVLYSTDASIYQIMPFGVLFPQSIEDVQAAVELASKYQVPILPRTSGTSLAGQAVNEALVIDMCRHLDKILEMNSDEHWVRVQPGIVLDELNAQLEETGLQFGPDPASSNRAALGGIVANNSTGSHSILYGMTADHVLETQVLLSDGSSTGFGPVDETGIHRRQNRTGLEGQIYRGIRELTQKHADVIRAKTPRHWRRCGGYNLDRFVNGPAFKYPRDSNFNIAQLISGSEGTLALITEIKLNLVPRPKHAGLVIVPFENLYEALAATPIILEVEPSAVELLDNLGLTLCRKVPAYSRLLDTFIEGTPYCVLITEFYGESEAEVDSKIRRLQKHLQHEKVGGAVQPVIEPQRQQNVWTVRKVGLGLMMSMKGDYKPIPFIEDAAVPVEHLAEYVTRIEEFCHDLGTRVAYYAHASAGCIHIRPLMNMKMAADVEKLAQISGFAVELLGQWGGVLSSEHGDGRSRSWLNERFFGKELYGLFRQVKRIFDPDNILNPGIIVDAQHITENLRYGPDYQVMPVKEHLDFSEEQGFHRAIEMCNGAGICRKELTGTMCPSFMVTREEKHSTRGRANALRAAISGLLPREELTSPSMYEVMDLCLECKACKAECPSSVDMAKIKFEFLAQYYKEHPMPLRTKAAGEFHKWQRAGKSWRAPLINWAGKNRQIRFLLEKTMGISRKRALPLFARKDFKTSFQKSQFHQQKQDGYPSVILFHDCFTNCFEPELPMAAVELLQAAGYQVHLSPHECCGRAMISKGLLKEARMAARHTIDQLAPFAAQGIPIVGLEPSCLLTLRDEYLYLLPKDPQVENVARNSFLFEEFLAQLVEEDKFPLQFREDSRKLLLHGHCHQKALAGTESSTKILSLLPGYSTKEVDSGCCGMAGSFGYEVEHYELSMAIGERRLFPAIRQTSEETIIVASGFSCRSQILHGTGRRAFHPAQVLRRAVRI